MPATAFSTAARPAMTASSMSVSVRKVSAAALEQGKLDAADLRAGLLLHNVGKTRGKATELGVAEAVGRAGLGLGNKARRRHSGCPQETATMQLPFSS